LLLLVSAVATYSSIDLLAETYDTYRLTTYEKAVERGLGRRFRVVVEVSILVFCCGTAVGYVIAVGDIIERVMPFLTTAQKQMAMSLVWLVAMLPLSCLKKMKSLECASSVGTISIGTLLVAAIVHLVRGRGGDEYYGGDNMYFNGSADGDDDFRIVTNHFGSYNSTFSSLLFPAGGSWLSVLQACPIFFYAFSSQVNVAQIFEELPGHHGNNPEKRRTMSHVTILGVLLCGLLYASVSLVTLSDFGDRVKPNILSCYNLGSRGQPLLHVAFLGMALAVVIAFPLNIFPARVSLIQMWEEKENRRHEVDTSDESSRPLSDIEGINQPLLSKETREQNVGYDSGGETDVNDPGEDPLRSPTETFLLEPSAISEDHIEDERTEEFRCAQHSLLTLLLAGLALGLALVVPNISVVFGLLGGTTSSLLGFVVPGLLGLEMDKNRVSAWVLVIFGSIIGVLTTGATVYSMFPS
jgi:amino acid permease